MGIARIILALVVAVAVAVLPAAAGAAFKPQSADATEMSASGPMPYCCPDQDTPCNKTVRDCAAMAACAANSFGLSPVFCSSLVVPLRHLDRVPVLASAALHGYAVGPPLRPPRS